MTDIAASTLARLKNKAKEENVAFQQILILFSQEEFFRRISKSAYQNNLVLKGGLFIYSLSGFSFRP
ncbi:MAG: nucleotidyl transferase AbiEii/AbiGii toxin family protein, partial [Bacteroidota bacterium]